MALAIDHSDCPCGTHEIQPGCTVTIMEIEHCPETVTAEHRWTWAPALCEHPDTWTCVECGAKRIEA